MPGIEMGINQGSALQFYKAMWGPAYEAVLNILGSTGTVLPIGDPDHGQPNATTFETVGEEQATFTWSEAPGSFDTSLDLTDSDGFQRNQPILLGAGLGRRRREHREHGFHADQERDQPGAPRPRGHCPKSPSSRPARPRTSWPRARPTTWSEGR